MVFYRKIYLKGILAFFSPIIILFIFSLFKSVILSVIGSESLGISILLVWGSTRVFFAFNGNYCLWKRYRNYFIKQQSKSLREYGGVNWWLPSIVLILIVSCIWILSEMMQGMRH